MHRLPGLRAVETYDSLNDEGCVFDAIQGTDESPIPILSRLRRDTLLGQPFLDLEKSSGTMSNRGGARSIMCILLALCKVPTLSRVQSLKLGNLPWFSIANTSVGAHDLGFWDLLRLGIPNLRTLAVTFQYGDLGPEQNDESSLSRKLAASLAATTQLESLTLSTWKPRQAREADILDITGVLLATTWSKLQHLEIGVCAVRGTAFATFLNRHSRTLKTFKASKTLLVPSSDSAHDAFNTWKGVFIEVAPALSLDVARMYSIVDSGSKANALADRSDCILFYQHQESYDIGVSQFLLTRAMSQYPVWGQVIELPHPANPPARLLETLREQ